MAQGENTPSLKPFSILKLPILLFLIIFEGALIVPLGGQGSWWTAFALDSMRLLRS
jgi:hypothetical protein